MSSRLGFSSQQSSRRREPSFPPAQTRGSSTAAWQTTSTTASHGTSQDNLSSGGSPTSNAARKKGPSLSLALQAGEGGEQNQIHPLKYTWDVWVSHRSANNNKNTKKDDSATGAKTGKEKETREEWEGAVVKLGGFSSVESMFPFLAHLTPPSALPASVNSSSQIFGSPSSDGLQASNNVTDYNVFRSSIAPAWEDPANAGGGRWVARLRKGVADRIWEETLFALVGERIGGDDDRVENKVNGLVLSVRKDEDILSLWCAPTNRTERDVIRDAFRAALEPSLPSSAAINLALDYKPHPAPNGAVPATSGPRHERERTESPHRSERHERRGGGEAGGNGRHHHHSYTHGDRANKGESNATTAGVPPLSGFGADVNSGSSRRNGSRGFPGYVARERTESGNGSVGTGGSNSFGRTRRGSASRGSDAEPKSSGGL